MTRATSARLNVSGPYCPYNAPDAGNRKIHFQLKKCANMQQPATPKAWIEIETGNPSHYNIHGATPEHPPGYFADMGTYVGRATR